MSEKEIQNRDPQYMKEELKDLVGESSYKMYQQLNEYIRNHYLMDELWSKGGKYGVYCLRYSRSKKTLCTIYFREKQIGIWIVLGGKEREKFEMCKEVFSKETIDLYNQTNTYHDGKWLMFDVSDNRLFEDMISLLSIKKKTNKKS